MKTTTLSTLQWPGWRPVALTVFALVLIALSSPGFAAKGGDPGPPVGGETSNNLSVPGIQTESATDTGAFWSPAEGPVLGVHYSWGCDKPESNTQFNYPNTSCVDNLDAPETYYTADECTATGAPCENYEVSRIYWQKVEQNEWSADDDGIADAVTDDFAHVYYGDWGDALEAVSWNELSVIRVETQPYGSTIPVYEPASGCTDDTLCKTGFQMWHVSGQGITEHWGVRATEAAVSYNYDWPFQIIKSTNARLNLTKLVPESADCPMPGGNPNEGPPEIEFAWTGSSWTLNSSPLCEVHDEVYSTETSVGGKYVYGYNWRMREVDLTTSCPGWSKTGYWRLTFYVPRDETGAYQDIIFHDEDIPNVAPPAPANCARAFPFDEDCIPDEVPPEPVEPAKSVEPAVLFASAESEDDSDEGDDRLYYPMFSDVNEYNLTYIDICIVSKTKGAGGGGGGGGGDGSGDGGGYGGGGAGGSPTERRH